MGAVLTLLISFGMLIGLLSFRTFENKREVVYLKTWRETLDNATLRSIQFVRRAVLREWKRYVALFFVALAHRITVVALDLVRMIERRLITTVNVIRGQYVLRARGRQVSSFLQSVVSGRKSKVVVKEGRSTPVSVVEE